MGVSTVQSPTSIEDIKDVRELTLGRVTTDFSTLFQGRMDKSFDPRSWHFVEDAGAWRSLGYEETMVGGRKEELGVVIYKDGNIKLLKLDLNDPNAPDGNSRIFTAAMSIAAFGEEGFQCCERDLHDQRPDRLQEQAKALSNYITEISAEEVSSTLDGSVAKGSSSSAKKLFEMSPCHRRSLIREWMGISTE